MTGVSSALLLGGMQTFDPFFQKWSHCDFLQLFTLFYFKVFVLWRNKQDLTDISWGIFQAKSPANLEYKPL